MCVLCVLLSAGYLYVVPPLLNHIYLLISHAVAAHFDGRTLHYSHAPFAQHLNVCCFFLHWVEGGRSWGCVNTAGSA